MTAIKEEVLDQECVLSVFIDHVHLAAHALSEVFPSKPHDPAHIERLDFPRHDGRLIISKNYQD